MGHHLCQEHLKVVSTMSGQASARIILVTFESHDDKLKLFKYLDRLRSGGIGISNDLSQLQRQQIKDANTKGFIAYFKICVLCKRPKRVNTSDRPWADGEIRRGVRTLDDRNREYFRRQDGVESNEASLNALDTESPTPPSPNVVK